MEWQRRKHFCKEFPAIQIFFMLIIFSFGKKRHKIILLMRFNYETRIIFYSIWIHFFRRFMHLIQLFAFLSQGFFSQSLSWFFSDLSWECNLLKESPDWKQYCSQQVRFPWNFRNFEISHRDCDLVRLIIFWFTTN